MGEDRGDGGQPGLGGGDLDHHVGPVDGLPQVDGVGDGGVGVEGQPRVHFDGHPAVASGGGGVDLGQHVAGGADIVGGQGADGLVGVDAGGGQAAQLGGVVVPGGESGSEDGRVGGHTGDVVVGDQGGEVAGGEPLPGPVVKPDGDARVAEGVQGGVHVRSPGEFN